MDESILALQNALMVEGIDYGQFMFAVDAQMVNYLAGYYLDRQLIVTRTADGKSMKMDARLVWQNPQIAVIDMRNAGLIS